ncbi:MAG TPA: PDZ domain-containing protein [Gemmatimonadales bacterium]|nr:PDZ domain-containing protein [Gemmatimonadales bacterium]
MMLRKLSMAAVVLSVAPSVAISQAVRYEVSIASAAGHLYHLKAEFPTTGLDTLLVSLPAWSPGNYEIQNYARFVRGFTAADAAGRVLSWDRLDKDTWRIATARSDRVAIEFDFLADAIDLSGSRLVSDFGSFLGTNVFLYQEGHLDRPADVRFVLPPGWKLATALRPAGPAYRAADYHELADAVTFGGRFSLDSLAVDGKWIRIAVYPAADYTREVARNLRDGLAKQAAVQNRLMGGPPYDVYTVFFTVYHDPIDFGGGLEHASSQFDIMPANGFADSDGTLGDFMRPLTSHEFFHLWNVKRIRPAEMWPYDYHGEQYTPLLWWSEGVTDYYGDITNWRAGLWSDGQWIESMQGNANQVESVPEPWSEEDGSAATWINEVFVNSSQLYYPKGSLTGLLMDVAIRDASDNRHSLDEVVRNLYTRFYKQGKGFRTADLLALLKEAGMPDVDGFYQRYINGRDPLPYEQILPKAGIAVERRTTTMPFLGLRTGGAANVLLGVVPGGAAAAAGVQAGDTLVSVGEIVVKADEDFGPAFRERYRGKAGQPLRIVVRREGQTLNLDTQVRERSTSSVRLSKASNPDARAARLWRGLATGTIGS